MNDDTINVCFRCPEVDAALAEEHCKLNDISMSDYITQALLMYIDLGIRDGLIAPFTPENTTTKSHLHG